MFNGYATLRCATCNVHLDQTVKASPFLLVGGCMGGAGMAFKTRHAAVALNKLGVVFSEVMTKFCGALCSAAGADWVHSVEPCVVS